MLFYSVPICEVAPVFSLGHIVRENNDTNIRVVDLCKWRFLTKWSGDQRGQWAQKYLTNIHILSLKCDHLKTYRAYPITLLAQSRFILASRICISPGKINTSSLFIWRSFIPIHCGHVLWQLALGLTFTYFTKLDISIGCLHGKPINIDKP